MNNNEIRARLLIEAAGLLEESYGKHGATVKFLETRYNNEKAKNDKFDANNEQKRKMYERAGYGDKLLNANRNKENLYKERFDDVKRDHDNLDKESKRLKAEGTFDYSRDVKNEYYDRIIGEHENEPKNSKLHERINNRAKSQNESVENLLNECYELLEEGAAWREGKPIKKETKAELEKIKKNDQYTKFIKGQLPYDEAEKLYNQVTVELDKFDAKVNAIPDENLGEKMVGTLIMPFKSIKNFLLSKLIPGGIIFSSIFHLNDKQYDKCGNLNYTRATIESSINKIRKSINNTWAKFYKNKKSVVQNESAYDVDIDDLTID